MGARSLNRNTVNFRAEKASFACGSTVFKEAGKQNYTVQSFLPRYVLKVSDDRSIDDIDASFLPPQRVPSLVAMALSQEYFCNSCLPDFTINAQIALATAR